jgi:hypothetical protein
MKKTLLSLLLPTAMAFAGGNVTLTGWISDAACNSGNASSAAGKRDCAKRCIEGGEAAVFVDDKEQKVYKVSDQAKAKAHLAGKVKVTGMVKGDTFQLTSIEDVKE